MPGARELVSMVLTILIPTRLPFVKFSTNFSNFCILPNHFYLSLTNFTFKKS